MNYSILQQLTLFAPKEIIIDEERKIVQLYDYNILGQSKVHLGSQLLGYQDIRSFLKDLISCST